MKIVIIGAGIAGLSTYLLLQKHLPKLALPAQPHEITIYEIYDTSRGSQSQSSSSVHPGSENQSANSIGIGGGLGVMRNGLSVLQRLSSSLYQSILLAGHPILQFHMSNARGWSLARLEEKDQRMTGVMIGRHSLWNCLREEVPDAAIVKRKVREVIKRKGSGRNVIVFADGDTGDEEADLVIGADGLRSVVRKAIFRDDGKEMYEAHYEDLVGVGGFVPSSFLTETGIVPGEMGIVFGSEGFFGYGYSSTSPSSPNKPGQEALWWSTYELPSCPDWRNIDREDARRQLITRHSHWKNATVRKIIENVSIDTVWPTWTVPLLPTWEQDGLVLVGDAAHALQPTSGQGTSQALEDSEAFVLLLSNYLREGYRSPKESQAETETEAREIAGKKYTDLRMPRIRAIYERSQKMGDMKRKMGVVQEMVMYVVLWLVADLWSSLGIFGSWDTYNDKLINYDLPADVERLVNL